MTWATHSRLQRATSARSGVGIVIEDGSGVAIDWVTGRSYSSARRRLNVQSGQRKGGKCAAAPYPSVAVRDRGHWKGVAGSGWVREAGRGKTARGWNGVRPGVRLKSWRVRAGEEPEEHKRMPRNVWNDIFELANRTTLQSIHSMHRWPQFQRRRIKLCRRIVKSILSNCFEMLKFGTYWKTWDSMVSGQICTVDYKMDQNMWQTIMSFGLLHSSYIWI